VAIVSARRAQLESLLEGVRLPAGKRELLEYARREDETLAAQLHMLPDRKYRSLDEVGEALEPAQPAPVPEHAPLPQSESGLPPGGDDYLRADAKPGAVRPHGPEAEDVPGS
jgi:hypothetical protein